MAGGEHVHNWALGALVEADVRNQSQVAQEAEVSPQHLGQMIFGKRAGTNPELRARIASALGVDVRAITCWCDDRPGNHGGDA